MNVAAALDRLNALETRGAHIGAAVSDDTEASSLIASLNAYASALAADARAAFASIDCSNFAQAPHAFFAALSAFDDAAQRARTLVGATLARAACELKDALVAIFTFVTRTATAAPQSDAPRALPACFLYTGRVGALVARALRAIIDTVWPAIAYLIEQASAPLVWLVNGVAEGWRSAVLRGSHAVARQIGRLAFFAMAIATRLREKKAALEREAVDAWLAPACAQFLEQFEGVLPALGAFATSAGSRVEAIFGAQALCLASGIAGVVAGLLAFARRLLAGVTMFAPRLIGFIVASCMEMLTDALYASFSDAVSSGLYTFDDAWAKLYKQLAKNIGHAPERYVASDLKAVKVALKAVKKHEKRVARALNGASTSATTRDAWQCAGALSALLVKEAPTDEQRAALGRALGTDFEALTRDHDEVHARLGAAVRASIEKRRRTEQRDAYDSSDEALARRFARVGADASTPENASGDDDDDFAEFTRSQEKAEALKARERSAMSFVRATPDLSRGADIVMADQRRITRQEADEYAWVNRAWLIVGAIVVFSVPIGLLAYNMVKAGATARSSEVAALGSVFRNDKFSVLRRVLTDANELEIDLVGLRRAEIAYTQQLTALGNAALEAPDEAMFRQVLRPYMAMQIENVEWRRLQNLWNGLYSEQQFIKILQESEPGPVAPSRADQVASPSSGSVREFIASRVSEVLIRTANAQLGSALALPEVRRLVTKAEERARDTWLGWAVSFTKDTLIADGDNDYERLMNSIANFNFGGAALVGARNLIPLALIGFGVTFIVLSAITIPRFFFDRIIERRRDERGFAAQEFMAVWRPFLYALFSIPGLYVTLITSAYSVQGRVAAVAAGAAASAVATPILGAASAATGGATGLGMRALGWVTAIGSGAELGAECTVCGVGGGALMQCAQTKALVCGIACQRALVR